MPAMPIKYALFWLIRDDYSLAEREKRELVLAFERATAKRAKRLYHGLVESFLLNVSELFLG